MLITQKMIIGKEEWCALPDLQLPAIKARIDSGARTSALHADNIEIFTSRGDKWVRFDINPIQKDRKITVQCRAPLVDERDVKSSSGHTERRAVIETSIRIGNVTQTIQLTATFTATTSPAKAAASKSRYSPPTASSIPTSASWKQVASAATPCASSTSSIAT